MENFNSNFNLIEIYSNSKISKSEDYTNDNIDLAFKQQITLKASKITDSRSGFNKIYKPYIEIKQIYIVCRQKPIIFIYEKLKKVYIDL